MKSGRLTVIVRAVLPVALALLCAASAHAALVVSKAATRNVTCTNGVCTATAANAVLNANDLAAMLAAGNVRMNSGATAMDIRIVTATNWASTNRLFLDAYRAVDIRAPLTVEGTGSLILTTNDGGTGGDITFENQGHIAFWDLSSGLIINGSAYTLVGDIATLVTAINAKPWGFFAWAKDYDASIDGAYKTAPIAIAFVGTFEGLGNHIEKIRFAAQKAGNFGLFALIENGGLVRDLALPDVRINIVPDANFAHIGTVAAENHGTIAALSSSGAIKLGGSNHCCARVGGLVAVDKGAILHSHSSIGITGSGVIGGLVGEHMTDGSSARIISDSYATGNMTAGGGSEVGGLVGSNTQGMIVNGHATGLVAAGVDNNNNSIAGGLAGVSAGAIETSFATGSVTANGYVGGLVGSSTAAIDGSFATGSVSANGYIGGLVGSSTAAIEASYATGSVTGSGNAGGLAGSNSGPVQTSFATGIVTAGSNSSAGGLIGNNSGALESSFATGSVSATSGSNSLIGGLIGDTRQTANMPIRNCYALGSVTGGVYAGGLVGKFDYGASTDISTSYSIGAASDAYYNGGFIGYSNETPPYAADVGWDTDTSGLSVGCGNRSCTGIKGWSDTQLKSELPAGFDSSIWGQSSDINSGYPYLLANPPR